ncbi:ATP-binding cassette domain-containing protein [Streptomyces tubbatahanensis]|uniref:ATP-binding cassette domain-containing protein n=1 Tax=Streptomyces tubbatahanensis TaxID=2923272 RepID=A0ABY3Y242_9ACTN|nr:ATP-binding cassette domain-containing protein [Streptomyces tubbatahanensis]UNT00691.1 ATP-binding cassette domain-containing protein [Streptomyces tubbatahanensis]
MTRPLIEVRRLTAHAADGTALVRGVDLTMEYGRVTALVGPSGSGKTTTALALLGEAGAGVRLSGHVRVGETEVVGDHGITAHAAGVRGGTVAYLPQHPGNALNPARRIGAILTELAALHAPSGGGRNASRALSRAALEQAQLPPERSVLRRFPHQFSGGQQQRVALAEVLACGPRVLVLDEPGTGLDTVTRAALTRELARLARSGPAILLLSHDHAMVRALADDTVVLEAGRVTARGTPEAVLPAAPAAVTVRESGAVRPDGSREVRPEGGEVCPDGSGEERPERTPLLEARSLFAWHRRRGHDVLHDVSLRLRAGECLGVAGPSGSGKTTLARCLAGLHERLGGDLLLDGAPLPALVHRDREQKRRVQYVWQDVHGSFDPRRTVLDQVARTAVRLRGRTVDQAREEAGALLCEFGIPPRTAARPPGALSGGELQRAAFARAALARPDVLVCDEITSALDAETAERVLTHVEHLRTTRTAVLWISHDLRLLRRVADRLLVLDGGGVAEAGACARVLARPGSEATRRLLDAEEWGTAAADSSPCGNRAAPEELSRHRTGPMTATKEEQQ